ncbi:hypothetical protein LSH36_742g01048 [Paralvinella palmiformis]|uniref:Carbohydrate sulfotransferase n=1 Tax=Paralvinella palmiformis TaxID=53620 RepID=A0AAD9MVL6_9ANNE|nr:hypothetical protein LSH36_742g01048 [Paralvinella palmiformis]
MQSYLSATGLRLLYNLDEDERRTVLDDYFKMIVVRHPLDRLRSAYTNKTKQAGTLNWPVLHKYQHIVEQFLRRKGKEAGVDGSSFNPMNMTIEFERFIDLVGADDEQLVDEHWMLPFYDTLLPVQHTLRHRNARRDTGRRRQRPLLLRRLGQRKRADGRS